VLVLEPDRPVSSDQLIDAVWGGRPPATAAKNVQVLVSQLRKALGERAIETVTGGYRVVLANGERDVDRFEWLLEQGRNELAAGRPAAAARSSRSSST
jgi:DNA-binding SARP family transcriptional activator